MKLLNPSESEGLLKALGSTLETQLTTQRNQVLREFSLDNKDGALARMVGELTTSHGLLTEALEKKINTMLSEFSLDREDSALSRLVRNVDRAQTTITREFSLDDESSALSRLAAILESHNAKNNEFQEQVKLALAKMAARREEAARSTLHGVAFEEAVCSFLEYHSQQAGDVATRVGHSTGLIKNCKKGDSLVELGPDCAAAGAKVVVEAKEEAGYSLADARTEIESARENRGAQVGLFVFSKRTAPEGFEEMCRLGSDVFVAWDPEDPQTNVLLRAALAVARALCIRVEQLSQSQDEDFQAITKAILEIEKQSQLLGEVTTSAETIKSGAEKVLERIRKTRASVERQIEILQASIGDLKSATQASAE
jgi:hypothetical protein